jgi:hypothetical protein
MSISMFNRIHMTKYRLFKINNIYTFVGMFIINNIHLRSSKWINLIHIEQLPEAASKVSTHTIKMETNK